MIFKATITMIGGLVAVEDAVVELRNSVMEHVMPVIPITDVNSTA